MSAEEYRRILADENRLREIARQNFDMIDTDRSGSIDLKELARAMEKTSSDFGLPMPTQTNEIEELRSLDKNGDGKVEFPEYFEYIRRTFQILAS